MRAIPFPPEHVQSSIAARFEYVADRAPLAMAVRSGAHSFTYASLDRAANRIGHALLTARGEDEEAIALLMGHDAWQIAAILGVLKAGKGYVALDPTLPRSRAIDLIENLSAAILLTDAVHQTQAEALAGGLACQVLNVAQDALSRPDQRPQLSIPAHKLAGVFFTSGSTGEPKGTMRNQSNILHRAWLDQSTAPLDRPDRVSLLYMSSFGASTSDIFGALLNGATLCMYDFHGQGVVGMADWLRREQISSLHLPVALFRLLLDTLSPDDFFPHLRLVAPAGRFYRADIERIRGHVAPGCLIVSRMSSSETSTIARLYIGPDTDLTEEVAPVGFVVPDKAILLVDENDQPVPDGEIGEVIVKSRYLSPGYWRRPDLTNRVFWDDPAGNGVRCYRMGDLARRRPDGCLEFHGRRDDRVKVRGFTVELGAVEAALHGLPGVHAAAVLAPEGSDGERRLVAYVAPATPEITPAGLRASLAAMLPHYMTPTAFVLLEALPLTANGKVDRRALPPPPTTRPELPAPYVAPRSPLEAQLAGIWAEALQIDEVGVHDPFLDLGGNSILAGKIAARVNQSFGSMLPIDAILRHATVAAQAAAIVQMQAQAIGAEALAELIEQVEGSELRPPTSDLYAPVNWR